MGGEYVLAYDMGTGGCKSSLYAPDGKCLNETFREYPTFYPKPGWHEQAPEDWWGAIASSTAELLEGQSTAVRDGIAAISLSGASLAMLPVDGNGTLLLDKIPIWSDGRVGSEELRDLFDSIPEAEWYLITGNGFPAPLYTIFKIFWLRRHHPEIFAKTRRILGSKDYINFRLTGNIATDPSYASGTGLFDLREWGYSRRLLALSRLDSGLFPDIVPSTKIIGTLTRKAAAELGLSTSVAVVAGGVDNSCMALGAMCHKEGRLYNSLGSSSWFSLSSARPVLADKTRPYVFAHVVPGQYISSTSIFSAGSSHKWYRNTLAGGVDYAALDREAAMIPPGCDGLMFNPTLAGGSSLDTSPHARGGFAGLTLAHTRGHVSRSIFEGVGFGLRLALDELRSQVGVDDAILLVGGGGKSAVWRQILADILRTTIVQTTVDQQAAALGAAALALVGCGMWESFDRIDGLHDEVTRLSPDGSRADIYEAMLPRYRELARVFSDDGAALT